MIPARILAEALEDLSQAVDRYNEQRPGLGEDFENLFYSSVLAIQKRPQVCPISYRSFRRCLLKRFPYSLYYRIYREEIIVALVFHLARSPRMLRRILRRREKLI